MKKISNLFQTIFSVNEIKDILAFTTKPLPRPSDGSRGKSPPTRAHFITINYQKNIDVLEYFRLGRRYMSLP